MKFKMVSILYKYHISQSEIMIDGDCEAWCRSFISIIFPEWANARELILTVQCRSFISIIFPDSYYFEEKIKCMNRCRSFISIIFPYPLEQHIRFLRSVSILYKYHISQKIKKMMKILLQTCVDPL